MLHQLRVLTHTQTNSFLVYVYAILDRRMNNTMKDFWFLNTIIDEK